MFWQRTWIINLCITEKRRLLLLRVIHAGKRRLCAEAEGERRGIVHRIEMNI